jgi:hypothetical protein
MSRGRRCAGALTRGRSPDARASASRDGMCATVQTAPESSIIVDVRLPRNPPTGGAVASWQRTPTGTRECVRPSTSRHDCRRGLQCLRSVSWRVLPWLRSSGLSRCRTRAVRAGAHRPGRERHPTAPRVLLRPTRKRSARPRRRRAGGKAGRLAANVESSGRLGPANAMAMSAGEKGHRSGMRETIPAEHPGAQSPPVASVPTMSQSAFATVRRSSSAKPRLDRGGSVAG